LADGPDKVYELIDKHQIECDAHRNGWILGAHKPKANDVLRQRAEFWAKRGALVEFYDADETERLTGSPRYSGSLLDRRSGGLNPLQYTRGLAKASVAAGAQVFENSEAISISAGTIKRWRVKTSNGQIEANHIIHCTNAYTGKLWPGLSSTIIPFSW